MFSNKPTISINIANTAPDDSFMYDYLRDFVYEFKLFYSEANIINVKYRFFKLILIKFLRLLLANGFQFVIPRSIKKNSIFIAPISGSDFLHLLNATALKSTIYLYIFDAWPRENIMLNMLCRVFKVDTVFFSSKQSAENFNSLPGLTKGIWVPEGISPNGYKDIYNKKRTIDIISFGRRYEPVHSNILKSKLLKTKHYIYDNIFDIKVSLNISKISICFSSDLTHPKRSEGISTMTQRYLQSMISGSLIYGNMPNDMVELFDYCPIVESDLSNVDSHILNILDNYNSYLDLVKKNIYIVFNYHQWRNRFIFMNICNSTIGGFKDEVQHCLGIHETPDAVF